MKVAVIGAGPSGLTAIKACLEEGLNVVCFEKENVIGGLWHFTENEGTSSVMRSTVINTSKQMMSYTDFPIPNSYPCFMHNKKVCEYLQLYAKTFDLNRYIRFGTVVWNVCRAKDFDETGQWLVEWTPMGEENVSKIEIYNGVMVCTGHHWDKNWPLFPGMGVFKGKQLHSKSYKDVKGYENKVVVLVGVGNSSGDISCELSRCAKQVYLSSRRGMWVMSRQSHKGEPFDLVGLRRALDILPTRVKEKLAKIILNARFDHKKWGIQPSHGVFAQHPMVNDDLPLRLSCGAVIIKPDIEKLTDNGVLFTDGTFVDNVDVIIYGTGYKISFPVLEKDGSIPIVNNRVELYKRIFPPSLSKQTLAVIGCFQPVGAIMPLSDLQCRLAAKVFSRKVSLPSSDTMLAEINCYEKTVSSRYYNSPRHTIQVDYISYADELAQVIGCRPNLFKMFFSDPRLALQCFFGPVYPQQYRLSGPNAWSHAREYVMSAHKYVYTHMSKNDEETEVKPWISWSSCVFMICIVLLTWYLGILHLIG